MRNPRMMPALPGQIDGPVPDGAVTPVPYAAARGLPVDVVSLDAIRRKASPRHLRAVQRPDFTMLVLYTAGQGEHVVDFACHEVSAGTLVVVTGGRTHQFRLTPGMAGTVLAVEPGFLLPKGLSPLADTLPELDWPDVVVLPPDIRADFLSACQQIEEDARRFAGRPLLGALLRQRLTALLVLLQMCWGDAERSGPAAGGAAAGLVRAFRALIERTLPARLGVAGYARKLGYAERTLTRACLACDGRSAKRIIDERLALEIRRWLANSDAPAHAIAARLGFPEPGHMTKFMLRVTGQTPSAFRAQWAAGAAPQSA